MSETSYSVRRATVDDLDGLKSLWEANRLQVLDLEKRLTEFQVVVTGENEIVAALGLRIKEGQGCLHSECYRSDQYTEAFRAKLWERIHNVARNYGLVRLWTEGQDSFWAEAGFTHATPGQLEKLPPLFGSPHSCWQVFQLREELVGPQGLSLDQEFEMFQAAQRANTERLIRQTQWIKWSAYCLLALAVLGAFYLLFTLMFQSKGP